MRANPFKGPKAHLGEDKMAGALGSDPLWLPADGTDFTRWPDHVSVPCNQFFSMTSVFIFLFPIFSGSQERKDESSRVIGEF